MKRVKKIAGGHKFHTIFTLVAEVFNLGFIEVTFALLQFLPYSIRVGATNRFSEYFIRNFVLIMKRYSKVTIDWSNESGRELPDRFLLLANHQSLAEIPILMDLFRGHPLRFVAKHSLKKGFIGVSTLMRVQGHAFIKRTGDSATAMAQLRSLARRCRRDGSNPVIFPEGTRSKDGTLGEFFSAGVRMILKTEKLPVVVAAIDGGWPISNIPDMAKNLFGLSYHVKIVEITDPITGKEEVSRMLSESHAKISKTLARLRLGVAG